MLDYIIKHIKSVLSVLENIKQNSVENKLALHCQKNIAKNKKYSYIKRNELGQFN